MLLYVRSYGKPWHILPHYLVTYQQLVSDPLPWILHKPNHNRELLWTFELFLRGSSVKVFGYINLQTWFIVLHTATNYGNTLGLFHTERNWEWMRKNHRINNKHLKKLRFRLVWMSPLIHVYFFQRSLYCWNQHFTTHLCLPYSIFFWWTNDSFMTSTTVAAEFDGWFLVHIWC